MGSSLWVLCNNGFLFLSVFKIQIFITFLGHIMMLSSQKVFNANCKLFFVFGMEMASSSSSSSLRIQGAHTIDTKGFAWEAKFYLWYYGQYCSTLANSTHVC